MYLKSAQDRKSNIDHLISAFVQAMHDYLDVYAGKERRICGPLKESERRTLAISH